MHNSLLNVRSASWLLAICELPLAHNHDHTGGAIGPLGTQRMFVCVGVGNSGGVKYTLVESVCSVAQSNMRRKRSSGSNVKAHYIVKP